MPTEVLDLAKGFGAAAPFIGLLLYLLWKSEQRAESERKERQDVQQENTDLMREYIALGVSLKSLLERVVTKIGA